MTQSTLQYPSTVTTPRVQVRPLLRNVFMWMTLGLALTTLVAFVTANSPALLNIILSPWIWGIFLAQLVLVVFLSMRVMKMSAAMATLVFLFYAALNGFTLTGVLLYYDLGTVTTAFLATAGLFGVMSLVGIFTKDDLTKLGTYLFIGLIGLLIALVINIFLRSSAFDLAISILGVLIFTGLTAYDVQKISRMAADPQIAGQGPELMRKLSIMGALALYLDFLNLFYYLLRLFGRNR